MRKVKNIALLSVLLSLLFVLALVAFVFTCEQNAAPASVTITEFSDFQCPYCKQVGFQTLHQKPTSATAKMETKQPVADDQNSGVGSAAPETSDNDSPYLNVWVHYDYMAAPDHSDAPSVKAIQMAVNAFKQQGVTLHIDPRHTAIPERKVIVPDWPGGHGLVSTDPSCTGPDAARFSELKATYFHPSANHPWHYVIFGHFVYTDSAAHAINCPATIETGDVPPFPNMLGVAQLAFADVAGGLGYNFVVSLGVLHDFGFTPSDMTEAALFMHELGHNLGLRHGGDLFNDQGSNYKPNYLSVMNYDFYFTGIPYAATPGSTTIAGYRLDYSDVKLPDLNEADLDENVGIQDIAHPTDITYFASPGGFGDTAAPVLGPIDWNQNGNTTDTHVAADLNPNFGALTVLRGCDDWAWIHSRLTTPVVNQIQYDSGSSQVVFVSGVNLMAPATVIFTGGVSAIGFVYGVDPSPGVDTSFDVLVPVGAQSGPITIITPEGTVRSNQSLTIVETASSPKGITSGPDGNLWFTEQDGNAIGRITVSGATTLFPVQTASSSPWEITSGPDGNVWFTERSASTIGRITSSGTITEFPLPTDQSTPWGIASGPDGNLWFTENDANKIGRITPSGAIVEYQVPTANSHPRGIAAGPDGNLWFTEFSGNKIGRITPSGTITEYPVPNIFPEAIAAGADGNLWFTEATSFATPAIGRITPSGTITYFPFIGGQEISGAPDGNLWFTQPDNVGRITPFGTWILYPIPTLNSHPGGITAGPDGNVWFTEQDGRKIGRITASGTITEFPIP